MKIQKEQKSPRVKLRQGELPLEAGLLPILAKKRKSFGDLRELSQNRLSSRGWGQRFKRLCGGPQTVTLTGCSQGSDRLLE